MRNTFIKKNKISVMNLLQSLYVAPLPTKMLHAVHDDWNQLKLDACFYPLHGPGVMARVGSALGFSDWICVCAC